MIHFTTFFALVVGGMEIIQPAAAGVLPGFSSRMLMNTFQRRQSSAPPVPPQCASLCDPVNSIISNLQTCTPSVCCLATFENSYFNCFTCAEAAVNVTDFTGAQRVLDTLYDECANLGIQLPVLTFPGQSTNRPLSSVVLPISTVSSISSLPPPSITQSTVGPSTSSTPATTLSQSTVTSVENSSQSTVTTPTPTSSSASLGIRSVSFNPITVAMLLGTWLYFAA